MSTIMSGFKMNCWHWVVARSWDSDSATKAMDLGQKRSDCCCYTRQNSLTLSRRPGVSLWLNVGGRKIKRLFLYPWGIYLGRSQNNNFIKLSREWIARSTNLSFIIYLQNGKKLMNKGCRCMRLVGILSLAEIQFIHSNLPDYTIIHLQTNAEYSPITDKQIDH